MLLQVLQQRCKPRFMQVCDYRADIADGLIQRVQYRAVQESFPSCGRK